MTGPVGQEARIWPRMLRFAIFVGWLRVPGHPVTVEHMAKTKNEARIAWRAAEDAHRKLMCSASHPAHKMMIEPAGPPFEKAFRIGQALEHQTLGTHGALPATG